MSTPVGEKQNYKVRLPKTEYRKVASSNTSCLEAHAGFFRLLTGEGDLSDPDIL